MEILKKGTPVYSQEGYGRFRIGSVDADERQDRLIASGKDITGEGKPNLVVVEFTGGAHCCLIYHVFEMGTKFRKIATIEAGDGKATFVDLDGDGKLEIQLSDSTWAYFPASFADSYLPRVVLRYKDGAYRPAIDLMRKPAPPWSKLEEIASRIRAGPQESDPWQKQLWQTVIELVYTGNAHIAWQFFEKACPPNSNNCLLSLDEFRERLRKRPYWPAIKAMNGL